MRIYTKGGFLDKEIFGKERRKLTQECWFLLLVKFKFSHFEILAIAYGLSLTSELSTRAKGIKIKLQIQLINGEQLYTATQRTRH